jgi:hypothetical protein
LYRSLPPGTRVLTPALREPLAAAQAADASSEAQPR